MANNSATALEGIRILKQGCSVTKYGRSGRPHSVTFRLSEDESMLSWKGGGLRESLVGKDERKVVLKSVAHLLVGRESAVFKRFQDDRKKSGRVSSKGNWEEEGWLSARKSTAGQLHLSLSLKVGGREDRDTLDVTFDDEILFGLWVAALRTLIPSHALGPDLRPGAFVNDLAPPPPTPLGQPVPSIADQQAAASIQPTAAAMADVFALFGDAADMPAPKAAVNAAAPVAPLGSSSGNPFGAEAPSCGASEKMSCQPGSMSDPWGSAAETGAAGGLDALGMSRDIFSAEPAAPTPSAPSADPSTAASSSDVDSFASLSTPAAPDAAKPPTATADASEAIALASPPPEVLLAATPLPPPPQAAVPAMPTATPHAAAIPQPSNPFKLLELSAAGINPSVPAGSSAGALASRSAGMQATLTAFDAVPATGRRPDLDAALAVPPVGWTAPAPAAERNDPWAALGASAFGAAGGGTSMGCATAGNGGKSMGMGGGMGGGMGMSSDMSMGMGGMGGGTGGAAMGIGMGMGIGTAGGTGCYPSGAGGYPSGAGGYPSTATQRGGAMASSVGACGNSFGGIGMAPPQGPAAPRNDPFYDLFASLSPDESR